MRLDALAICLAVAGCSAGSTDLNATLPNWQAMSFEQRQAALNAIADDCKLARSAFQMASSDELHFQPDPASTFESVDCALVRLKAVRGFGKMGFVGNEALTEDKK